MKQHTILLVACLMTIPAVAAENPCDDGSCGPSASDPMGPAVGLEAGTSGDCPLVTYWYQTSQSSGPSVGADLNTQCITLR